MKITFFYVKKGTTCSECGRGNIWLDVGNSGVRGVFDHHAGGLCGSTVELLASRAAQLGELLDEAAAQGELTIYLHNGPDLDAMGSVFLVREYLRWGREGFEARYHREKGRYKKLIQYINNIEIGVGKTVTELTLYALASGLGDAVREAGYERYEEYNLTVEAMRKCLEKVTEALETEPDLDLAHYIIPPVEDRFYEAVKRRIEDIEPAYERDKEANVLEDNIEVEIFTKEGFGDGGEIKYGVEKVRAAIWSRPPVYSEEHVIARRRGAVLTFVPYGDDARRGVMVAINPETEGYERFTLTPFAEIAEMLEQKYDAQKLEEEGRLPRDYSKWRARSEKDTRFAEKPFAATADPWYFSNGGDMVDVPGRGTGLQWDEMIEILKQHTHFIKNSYLVEFYAEEGTGRIETAVCRTVSHISGWKRYCGERFSRTDGEYRFLITEIDAEMISHSYEILDSYYAYLTGASLIDKKHYTCLHFDYRTHLYCGMRCGVLFIATQGRTTLEGLLDLKDEAAVGQSKLINIVLSLVSARKELRDISRFLGEVFQDKKAGSSKRIKEQERKLVFLNSRMRKDSVIDVQIGHEIYQCISESFGIENLRGEVNEEMRVVCEYSKDRIFGTFEKLSILTVPFLVLGTIFQIGIMHIEPIWSITEHVLAGWLVFLAWVVLITGLLFAKKR